MVQLKAPVVLHKKVAPDHFLMRLKAPEIARESLPGQFIHVRCAEETFPLLRRPFSLLDANPQTGTIDFIYKVVGLGTGTLAGISQGSRIDVLGPLGHTFEIPSSLKRASLVGGGVGIPPLYLLAKRLLDRGVQVDAFLGARTKGWLICTREFRQLGIPVHVATDDGTLGFKGSVVTLLKGSIHQSKNPPTLYICGPTPMMAAAAKLAHQMKLPAQVSLEERMGCAMGCCMGCVVEVATEPVTAHTRFQRVCTEGPIFPAEAIVWK